MMVNVLMALPSGADVSVAGVSQVRVVCPMAFGHAHCGAMVTPSALGGVANIGAAFPSPFRVAVYLGGNVRRYQGFPAHPTGG
jgi:hypothetical protein